MAVVAKWLGNLAIRTLPGARRAPCACPSRERSARGAGERGHAEAVVCSRGEASGARGGQCLCAPPRRTDGLPVFQRSVFRPAVRRAFRHPARAHREFARFRRARQRRRRRRHQQPRYPGKRRGGHHRCLVRRAGVSGEDDPQGRTDRPCGASPRGRGRGIPIDRLQRFRQPRSRRHRARHRRSVRRRANGDERHRLGACPHASRHLRLSVLHSDRCRHQSRQFGRRARGHGRASGRDQYRDLLQERRLARHRICNSVQHGAARGRVGAERRQGPAALAWRRAAKAHARYRRLARASRRLRARSSPRFTPKARRRKRACAPATSW